MSNYKNRVTVLGLGFLFGACSMSHVAFADGTEESEAMVAHIRQLYDMKPLDFVAINDAKERLKRRIREGDAAAWETCARAFDELRIYARLFLGD